MPFKKTFKLLQNVFNSFSVVSVLFCHHSTASTDITAIVQSFLLKRSKSWKLHFTIVFSKI